MRMAVALVFVALAAIERATGGSDLLVWAFCTGAIIMGLLADVAGWGRM